MSAVDCGDEYCNYYFISFVTFFVYVLTSLSVDSFADDSNLFTGNSQEGSHLLVTDSLALEVTVVQWPVSWHSGKTLVFGRRTSTVLRSTCS